MSTERAPLSQEDCERILMGRVQITDHTKSYNVRCISVNPYTKAGQTSIGIINFDALTAFHAEKAERLYSEEDYQGATNCKLSMSVYPNTKFVPQQGEVVKAQFKQVVKKKEADEDPNVDIMITVLDRVFEIRAENAPKVAWSFAKKTEEVAETADSTEGDMD